MRPFFSFSALAIANTVPLGQNPVSIMFNLPAGSVISLSPSNAGWVFAISPNANIQIVGSNNGLTIQFDRAWNQQCGIFFINSEASVSISNLTISNGNVRGNGGAIYNKGNLTLTRVQFSDNDATANGGAIYNWSGGVLTMRDCVLTSNGAGYGGALSNYGRASIQDETQISFNGASGEGGAIYNARSAQLQIQSGTFISFNNAGTFGGGILNMGTLAMQGGSLSWNTSLCGGGLANDGGTADFTGVYVTDNSAVASTAHPRVVPIGGAVLAIDGSVTFTGCTIWDNICATTGYDGGARLRRATLTLVNPNTNNLFNQYGN